MSIPYDTFLKVKKLLDNTDLSMRQIAFNTGVSRATIDSILHNKHKYQTIQQDKISQNKLLDRCPECGGMVTIPCLACKYGYLF